MRQRKAVEDIQRQKHSIIAALYSNPNWDDEKAKRGDKINELEKSFSRAIDLIYHPELAKAEDNEIDWDSPFWQASKRWQERVYAARPELRDRTVGSVIQMDKEQLEARARSRREIDQVVNYD